MNASVNRVLLLGNLTRDPEVRYLPSGQANAALRMATTRRFKTQQGEEKEETCFVDVVVWGKQAEACGQYLSMGSPLFVEGRLQYEEWEKDGQKHNRVSIVAERTQFVGAPPPRRANDDGGAAQSAPEKAAARKAVAPAASPAPAGLNAGVGPGLHDEDNLPF